MLTSQWIGDKYLLKNGQMARSRWWIIAVPMLIKTEAVPQSAGNTKQNLLKQKAAIK
mgnify:CR=1 FL=1